MFLEALYLRSYVDPNRNETEVDPSILAEPWPGQVERSARVGLRSGLIWSNIPPDIELYDRKLSVAEVRGVLQACGYHVQVNVHYKGNHLVRGYADPANGHTVC